MKKSSSTDALSLNFLATFLVLFRAMARCLELKLIDLFKKGKSLVYAQVKVWSNWSRRKVIFVAFSSGSVGQPSFPLPSS